MTARVACIALGTVLGMALAFGLLSLIGTLFGPFHEGESGVGRNMGIVLASLVALGAVGGFLGDRLYRRRGG